MITPLPSVSRVGIILGPDTCPSMRVPPAEALQASAAAGSSWVLKASKHCSQDDVWHVGVHSQVGWKWVWVRTTTSEPTYCVRVKAVQPNQPAKSEASKKGRPVNGDEEEGAALAAEQKVVRWLRHAEVPPRLNPRLNLSSPPARNPPPSNRALASIDASSATQPLLVALR